VNLFSPLLKRYLLCQAILLIPVGCGKKGPPIPYDVTVPRAISDLEVLVREAKPLLEWSIPRKAVDGSEVRELGAFRILREETPLQEKWCEECPERLELLDVLELGEDKKKGDFSIVGNRVVYQDKRVAYGHVYVYRVISVTTRGYESAPSNRAVLYWDTPPAPPAHVEATPEDRAVSLVWDPVEGAQGYRIYRGHEEGGFGEQPTARLGPNELSYRDTGLTNDVTYVYAVRSVRKIGQTWLESLNSSLSTCTPKDMTPPARPQGLLAVPLAGGIELSWQRNLEEDLLGYFVYRRGLEEGAYSRLNETPLKVPLYLDRTALLGETYLYTVTAVDGSPQRNESPFSEPVRVRYVR